MFFENIVNSKKTWYILSIIAILLLIVLLLIPTKNNKDVIIDNPPISYSFELRGDRNVTIYEGDEYIEKGFVAFSSVDSDLSNMVQIKGNVDNTKVGIYEIHYVLNTSDYSNELIRIVEVVEKPKKEFVMDLIGDETIYLNKNEEYTELGVKAYLDEEDVSNDVIIKNEIKKEKGIYKVEYLYELDSEIQKKERTVIVIDIDSYFKVNESTKTIEIEIDDNIKYVKTPDGMLEDKVVSYKITDNGTYVFYVYTNDLKSFTKEIEVNIIDKTPPTGTCKAVLRDGKTSYTVTTTDTDIKTYNYNGLVNSTSRVYSINKYIRENVYVELTDTSGNKSKINCTSTMESLPVKKPSGSITYTAESDTLKVYIQKNSNWVYSYIWAKDPSRQLLKASRVGYTDKKIIKEIVESAIGNNYKDKIVLGFNAGDPIWSTDSSNKKRVVAPFYVVNGKVYYTEDDENRDFIYYISGNNQLRFYEVYKKSSEEKKKIYKTIENDDPYNTFTFSPVLVQNGVAGTTQYYKGASYEYYAYRQGLCQVDTNNFILISSMNGKTHDTVEFGKMMEKAGCKTGINLDGGGSVQTVYKAKGTNDIQVIAYNKKDGSNMRSNTGALYFTELN